MSHVGKHYRRKSFNLVYGTVIPLYLSYDLCNDIHRQSGFTDCPKTSHTQQLRSRCVCDV